MEPVEFLGIVFRSAGHVSWFKFTMVMMALSIIVSGGLLIARVYIGPSIVWGCHAFPSFLISLRAVFATKFGAVNGSVWSVDCIWYNGMLAGIYFFSAALCLRFYLFNPIEIFSFQYSFFYQT